MSQKSWSPGWFSLIGSTAVAAGTAPHAVLPIILAGAAAGLALDGTAHLWLKEATQNWIRNLQAIEQKLKLDLATGTLKSWTDISAAYDAIRIQLWDSGVASRNSPVLAAKLSRSLQTYLRFSQCWDGKPLPQSLELLQLFGPLHVQTASINAGIEAALLIMKENFGIPLVIQSDYVNGIAMTEALSRGDRPDFVIGSDANFFLIGTAKTESSYRLTLPCGWQKHYKIGRIRTQSYNKRQLWYARGSTAQHQIMLKRESTRAYAPKDQKEFIHTEMGSRINDLNPGQVVISWDPFVSLFCTPGSELVAKEIADYRLSTSLFCHTSLCTSSSSIIRNAFQDAFIAAWNKARIDSREMSVRLLLDSNFRSEFRKITKL